MNEHIGISEDRLHHIIGVARKCYNIGKEKGLSEETCRKLFMLGYLHDVGYEFSINQEDHEIISAELLKNSLGITDNNFIKAIENHGKTFNNIINYEQVILITADLTTDSKGNNVTVQERLKDIKSRYGKKSEVYKKCYNTASKLGLI